MRFKTTIKVSLLLLLFAFVFHSCGKKTEAEIPAYIVIDSVGVNTDIGRQGAGSHNITDFWVYVNEDQIGVFNKKQLIPILAKNYNDINIKIYAGIRSNGLKNNIDIYFLYKNIELNKSLSPGEIDTINAIFKYDDYAKFVFVEGFENGNIFNKDDDGNYNTKISVTGEKAIYGNKCGLILLDKENNKIQVTTKDDFYDLPKEGNKVFLELDYLCDTEFVIGISGKDELMHEYKEDVIILKKRDFWNKIYLNLTEYIKRGNLESYKVFFKATNPVESDQSKVFLDNIKLVYLNR